MSRALTSNEKGAIAEQRIAAEAIRLGVGALRPAVQGSRYDLGLDAGEQVLRVQCKWACSRTT